MKPKSNCEDCGRLVVSKKLHKSQVDGRLLCDFHYKEENKKRNGLRPVSVPGLSKPTQIKKKGSGKAKMGKNYSYVYRGEGDYLKKKYGKGYSTQVGNLKDALGTTRMKMVMDNSESIDRQKREKDMQKRLVEDLYSKKGGNNK